MNNLPFSNYNNRDDLDISHLITADNLFNDKRPDGMFDEIALVMDMLWWNQSYADKEITFTFYWTCVYAFYYIINNKHCPQDEDIYSWWHEENSVYQREKLFCKYIFSTTLSDEVIWAIMKTRDDRFGENCSIADKTFFNRQFCDNLIRIKQSLRDLEKAKEIFSSIPKLELGHVSLQGAEAGTLEAKRSEVIDINGHVTIVVGDPIMIKGPRKTKLVIGPAQYKVFVDVVDGGALSFSRLEAICLTDIPISPHAVRGQGGLCCVGSFALPMAMCVNAGDWEQLAMLVLKYHTELDASDDWGSRWKGTNLRLLPYYGPDGRKFITFNYAGDLKYIEDKFKQFKGKLLGSFPQGTIIRDNACYDMKSHVPCAITGRMIRIENAYRAPIYISNEGLRIMGTKNHENKFIDGIMRACSSHKYLRDRLKNAINEAWKRYHKRKMPNYHQSALDDIEEARQSVDIDSILDTAVVERLNTNSPLRAYILNRINRHSRDRDAG